MKTFKALTGEESISGLENNKIRDFWSWAYSDILNNRNRGIFAEYLIASALGIHETQRIEWNNVDLIFKNLKIEIKTSGYVQSWDQPKLSYISFDICKKKGWNAQSGQYASEAIRCADVYVFCVYVEKMSKEITDLINIKNWEFFVVSSSDIERKFGNQKKVALSRIKGLTTPINYQLLKEKLSFFVKQI